MQYDHINVPPDGEAITANADFTLNVPDFPVIPYIEGDGIGIDVTPVMLNIVEAAVETAYNDDRQIRWMPVYAGQRATEIYGDDAW
ncbi:MAG: NADP-dependent isocitrate dehydrogenase, partial [Woeseiaceae bacterium]|nr:NADP-dependent isocitrate dehydrogenase [Gammaproteobacteria bacterium]NNK24746.1 NADP-dependent isocitrate dehydrogenase [Woeseiaceae bacterium]